MTREQLEQKQRSNPFLALTDVIYQVVKEDIIQLRIPPGTRLAESRLADELGISRTPVKSALTKLTQDNLIYKQDGRVSVVSAMTKFESRKLFEARIALEGHAAYLAVTRIKPSQLKEMEKLVEQYTKIGNHLNPASTAHAEVDHLFHKIVIAASCNEYIEQMYKSIESRLLHYRYCLLQEVGSGQLQPILYRAAIRHRAVYNAIRLGFTDLAKSAIEQDISGMMDAFAEWK